MKALHDQIADAKRCLPVPELLRRLNLGEHARKTTRCPLHNDQSPSFSVWPRGHEWFWKCHSGCGEGDEIDFLAVYRGVSRVDAIRQFREMAGNSLAVPMRPASVPKPRGIKLPDDATPGTEADWRALAALRNLDVFAVATAAKHLGTLYFGTVFGKRCWIITDERGLCAEARRMALR